MLTPDQQIFVVADIAGQYEILSALQYRWWDKEPQVLTRCLNLLKIFQAGSNEADVKRELSRAKKQFELDRRAGVQHPKDRSGQRDQVNYPFILTCLWVGASLDFCGKPESVSQSSHQSYTRLGDDGPPPVLKYTLGDPCVRPPIIKHYSWIEAEGTNDRTIIDITEPAQPRFGIFSFGHGDNNANGVWTGPMGLVSRHGPRYFHDRSEVYEELKSWPKIRLDALQSLGPDMGLNCEPYNASDAPSTSYRAELRHTIAFRFMFSKGLAAALGEKFLSDGVQAVAFQHLLIDKMRAEPDLSVPVQAALLATILMHAKEIDLSPFVELKAPMLWEAFSQLRHSNPSGPKTLILPDLDDMTGDIFSAILKSGVIYELNQGATPRIGLEELLQRIRGTRLRTFTCPALYQRSFMRAWRELVPTRIDGDGNQLYQWRLPPTHATPASSFPNGTGTLFPLTRVVYICVDKNDVYPRTPHGNGLLWSKLLRDKQQSSDVQFPTDYRGVGVWVHPFQASLKSCASLARTIPQLISQLVRLSERDIRNCNSDCAGVAATIATMRAAVGEDLRIRPILAEQDMVSWSKARKVVIPPMADTEAPDDWTLYVFHERADHSAENSMSRVRHAFVGTSSQGDRHVVDGEHFFKYMCSKFNPSPAEAQLEASSILSEWTASMTDIHNEGELGEYNGQGERLKGRFSFGSAGRAEILEAMTVVQSYNSSVVELVEDLERHLDRR